MKTPQYFIIIYMIILCWFVLLCYSSHVVETGYGEHSSIKCIDRERKALLRFKQGIKSDDGGRLSSWGVTEDCCYWHGIGCSNRTGHVIMLNLPAYANGYMSYLEGKLDPSLFELTHLKYLDLSKNGFFQTIPSSIDSLTELEYLNLSSAGFFGEIPPQLGNLSKLASLDLRFYYDPLSLDGIAVNNLTAKSLRWMSGLTLLRELHLSEGSNLSEATDWVQTINNLPSLRKLYLDECQLPATFSSSSLSYINSSSSLRVVSNVFRIGILSWIEKA